MSMPRLRNGCSILLLYWKAVIVKGISKSTASSPLGPRTFLDKVNTSGVKIRPVFKIFVMLISQSRKREKLILRK